MVAVAVVVVMAMVVAVVVVTVRGSWAGKRQSDNTLEFEMPAVSVSPLRARAIGERVPHAHVGRDAGRRVRDSGPAEAAPAIQSHAAAHSDPGARR